MKDEQESQVRQEQVKSDEHLANTSGAEKEAHEADQHAAPEHDHDDEEESLDLTKAPAEEETWLSHWPLLTALLILIVMLTLEYGFKYQPPFPVTLIIF